ncbi:tRNA (adenosine(37)-N6)-threonylcarbamoyltransferase complex ATPase subunit type 1 TsaE [Jeotgalicoccus coquinae]|uniref:tRNA threonylcarbamoyladenosine biosynthesis protein TsaE n=1 Tax=Jeotgalicoccus coquinae TaxID=709509 RepID=A0A6V7RRE0_9STAP|nr:tRNA (adenosine(37)-N6)-threonylcarbamoyltransferase complex ATPase subunit type 1 TsaE [Jeotgalicoccus coquinae]MBB6424296.1 tRNA threonylcarbamoyladenosine biosynthesis protein TsaE [Jeotgalicoccus coquinae]GGE24945.1 tRNA (adenosine(37)-N6)-threonylcarbamoyltransferase complex ATPase subunit type 1 TsaE [Jeotgalicoccus coquinae]CAD2081641.1 tRNA threonylcarbamoyladenosine biosynthesis protein TsaE [Jeotgalicoccus coquinae]
MHTLKLNSLADTKQLAEILAGEISGGTVIMLSGDLGSGKTTFSQFLGKYLGVKRHMTSPTFNIIKSYNTNADLKLHHMDCYRLEDSEEDLGFDEYFNDSDIALVEWPQFIAEFLPEDVISININYESENERFVTIEGTGDSNIKIAEDVYDKFTS